MRAALVALFAVQIASACSCAPVAYTPLCQRIDAVRVLFIGTALETNDNQDGYIKARIWYRFSVEEVFKGLPPDLREIIVDPASGTSCQEGYSIGKRYLISSYGSKLAEQQAAAMTIMGNQASGGKARPPGPVVVTGVCSGSRGIEHAKADVEFVRQYVGAPQPARITGSVRSHVSEYLWSDRYPPLPGVNIAISGPGARVTRTTDSGGQFEVPEVQPGKYWLTATLEGYASARASYEIEVLAHGCGVANISMRTNAAISGRVLHANGSPAREVRVEVHFADPKYAHAWLEGRSVRTDSEGHFKIAPLPAGELLVGVNIDSAPKASEGILPTYWPGVADPSKAQPVRLAPNEQRQDLVIRLGPRTPSRTVTVRVQWPDGRPVPHTNVSAHAEGGIAEMGETDERGVRQLVLLEGVGYRIKTRAWTSYRMAPIGKIGDNYVDGEAELPEGAGPAEVIVILNKPKPKLYE